MQAKLRRIFRTLKQSRHKGMEESGLLYDFESSGNARTIKYKLNKILGKGSVYVEDGIWYLSKEYWDYETKDFNDTMITRAVNRFATVLLVAILATLVSLAITGVLLYLTIEI